MDDFFTSHVAESTFSWLADSLTEEPYNVPIVDSLNAKKIFSNICTDIKHSSRIVDVVVVSDLAFFALQHGVINVYLVDDKGTCSEVNSIDLKMGSNSIEKMYAQPEADHLIVLLKSKRKLLIRVNDQAVHLLTCLNKISMTSVGWCNDGISGLNIIVGADDGTLYEIYMENIGNMKSFYEALNKVCVVSGNSTLPITDIQILVPKDNINICYFFVATANRIFHFMAQKNSRFKEKDKFLFLDMEHYFRRKENVSDIPGEQNNSIKINPLYEPSGITKQILWHSGSNIGCAFLKILSKSRNIGMDELLIIPMPNEQNERIISSVITKYHYIVLFPRRLMVFSNISRNLLYQDAINNHYGQAMGLVKDPVTGRVWLFTDQIFFLCDNKTEDEDIWKEYADMEMFSQAKAHCGNSNEYLQYINIKEADWYFNQKEYMAAAKLYATSVQNFEAVMLKLSEVSSMEPLMAYLSDLLLVIDSANIMQGTIVFSMLLRHKICHYRDLGDMEKLYTELKLMFPLKIVSACLKTCPKFFYDIVREFSEPTLFSIIAKFLNDTNTVIKQHINAGEISQAMEILKREKSADLVYEISPLIITEMPNETVNLWISLGSLLKPEKLLPSMNFFSLPKDLDIIVEVVRYLEFSINYMDCISSIIHDRIISLYCLLNKEKDLEEYFISQYKNPCYDFNFSLRICSQHGFYKCSVHIFASMSYFADAVDLALKFRDYSLAKSVANKQENTAEKRNLWLKIAEKALYGCKDVSFGVMFIKECDLLKIEDLLPFFEDFTYMDQFKDAICESLESYKKEMDVLDNSIKHSMNLSQHLKKYAESMQKRHIYIKSEETCSICDKTLFLTPFYAFACNHMYHQDCFIQSFYKWTSKDTRYYFFFDEDWPY